MPGGLFEDGAAVRRVDGELVLLLGGPRALLMQLAHPMVARGVAEHSGFRSDPFARLERTLEAVSTMVFGTEEQARATAARIHAIHERIVGDGYEANDPELLLWVHATIVDTALRIHNRFLRPLPAAEADRYYRESMVVGELMGIPLDRQPPNLTAFRAYVRRQAGTLVVSDEAKRLAKAVLRPRVPLVAEPAVILVRNLTAGLLPPPLRRGYELGWDPARQAALLAATVTLRSTLPFVPPALRRARGTTGS